MWGRTWAPTSQQLAPTSRPECEPSVLHVDHPALHWAAPPNAVWSRNELSLISPVQIADLRAKINDCYCLNHCFSWFVMQLILILTSV